MKRIISVILLLLFCGTAFAGEEWDWERSKNPDDMCYVTRDYVSSDTVTMSTVTMSTVAMDNKNFEHNYFEGYKVLAFRTERVKVLLGDGVRHYVKLETPIGKIITGYLPENYSVYLIKSPEEGN